MGKVLHYYPYSNASAFTTNVSGLSSLAAGQQQRANVCPHLPGRTSLAASMLIF